MNLLDHLLHHHGVQPVDTALAQLPTTQLTHQENSMSFFGKFENAFKKLFGSTPTWVHYGQSVVAFTAPIALTVITIVAPELLPVAQPIIAEIQADLATVSVLVGDGTATDSLTSALARIQTNLTALDGMAHVKDAKTSALVALTVGELNALAGMLPKPVTAAAQ